MTQALSQPDASTPETACLPDQADISIVIQGSLYAHNFIETITACEHWRRLFPCAQIIFSISTTDVICGAVDDWRRLTDARLVPVHRYNSLFQTALSRLVRCTDCIVLSFGGLPLPPIKFDTKINNINLQIAAAKSGLAQADRTYTLRIRSDIVFTTSSFIQHYFDNYNINCKDRAIFKQRVMISPYFTLNPYTMERLPFHFSDWFHFGLTEDIKKIWNVDDMSLFDATFYNWNKHALHSNAFERKFRTRLAVEQFISKAYLSHFYPSMVLEYINDLTSVNLSMDILLAEFLIADMHTINVIFDKYQKVFSDKKMELLCITHAQWRHLNSLDGEIDYWTHYASAARKADFLIRLREDPLMRPLRLGINICNLIGQRVRWLAGRIASLVGSGDRSIQFRPVRRPSQPVGEVDPRRSSGMLDHDVR